MTVSTADFVIVPASVALAASQWCQPRGRAPPMGQGEEVRNAWGYLKFSLALVYSPPELMEHTLNS